MHHQWDKSSIQEPATETPNDMISHFQGVHDLYTRKAGKETDRFDRILGETNEVRKQIMVLKSEKKFMGGINASRQQFVSVNKEIHTLENRLNKILVRHSELSQTNRNLKDQVDTMRRTICNRKLESNKITAKYNAKEEQLRAYLDASEQCNAEREEANREMQRILKRADDDTMKFEIEMQKHADYIANQKKMREKVNESLSKRKKPTDTPSSPQSGGLSLQEEIYKKEKLGKLKRSLTRERKTMKMNQEKILTHQEAFEKLRHATGIDSVNEMVRVFVEKEDFNFALFNHIQRLNKEATECDDEVEVVNEEVRKYQQEQGNDETTRVQIMHDLELKRDNIAEKANALRARTEDGREWVGKICEVVERLYELLGCKHLISEGAPGSPSDVLRAQQRSPKANFLARGNSTMEILQASKTVDEFNLMIFMGVVEQRVHEYCDVFARKVKQQAVDFGPQCATGDHAVAIVPPNAEDANELDDSDDDDDEIKLDDHHARPLSVAEMKGKAEKKWRPAKSESVAGPFCGGPHASPSLASLGAHTTIGGAMVPTPQGREGRVRGSVVFVGKQQGGGGKMSNVAETLSSTL